MNEILKSNNDKYIDRIYFPELDGLRFLAFILVFIHHQGLFATTPYLSVLKTNGWIGVDLFFVLSAFLFTKLLIAENDKSGTISFKKFYIRRIFRIWPIYFLFIGFSLLLYTFVEGVSFSKYVEIRLIGLLTFSDNIITAFMGYNPISYVAHLWTIGYEEQFYVFIPIIIFLLVRSSYRNKVIIIIITLIIFNLIRFVLIAIKAPHPAIWVLPITHFESIIMGIIIGFSGLDVLLKRIKPLILGFIGILFFILICQLPGAENISYWLVLIYSFVGISTALVLYSVINSVFLKEFFSTKILVFLGKRSYGLYVYHLFGIAMGELAVKHIPFLPYSTFSSFLFSLSFTIMLASISYKVIEKPFLILKKKFEVITSRPI